MFYDEVNDVLAAADALAVQPYVDSTGIFVSGHSAGGTGSDPAKHRVFQAQRTEALCSRDPSRISSS
jgi:poly(3-hydroxybutyrate) depolymerase